MMARSYSEDLRERVLDAVLVEGMSCRGAAKRYGIGESSAIRWVRRFRTTGKRSHAGTGGHRPSKLKPHRDWLLSLIAAQPDLTLCAICAKLLDVRDVKADTGMVSRFFIAEGISFKKKRSSHRTGQA